MELGGLKVEWLRLRGQRLNHGTSTLLFPVGRICAFGFRVKVYKLYKPEWIP